jgi:sulfur-oxidizing protein SoxB
MVRVGGMSYSCDPDRAMGKRISDMRLGGKPSRPTKNTRWRVGAVAEEARSQGNKQVWEVVETWLAARGGKVAPRQLNTPKIIGALPNPGYAQV